MCEENLMSLRSAHGRRIPASGLVRLLLTVVALLGVLVMAGACVRTTSGRAVAAIDTENVGGLPVRDGPSGQKGGVPDAELNVLNTDRGEMDRLAANSIADLQKFWAERFPEDFDLKFEPIRVLVSYDSTKPRGVIVCAADTSKVANAFYCPPEDTIAWDRGLLLPAVVQTLGTEMAAVLVLAHEFGHAVQTRLGIVDRSLPTIVAEQQADCFAGAFMRHVAEGKSEHFQLSTGDGLNAVLAGLLAIRDQVGAALTGPGAHGTAFDRVTAFQFGFVDGPPRCAEIDVDEVSSRATELGFTDPQDRASQGNMPIDDKRIGDVVHSLNEAFKDTGVQPPQIGVNGPRCVAAGAPAVYCPDSNIVALDVPELARLATPRNEQLNVNVTGDFTAFGLLASRYSLAVQNHLGLDLNGASAGLRSACLVGAWAGLHQETPFGNRNPLNDGVRMSPGDVDEAVSELLADGLMASDVEGQAVKSGFARVEAFRIGFLQGGQACVNRFP
jgi:predicted metalloprotease